MGYVVWWWNIEETQVLFFSERHIPNKIIGFRNEFSETTKYIHQIHSGGIAILLANRLDWLLDCKVSYWFVFFLNAFWWCRVLSSNLFMYSIVPSEKPMFVSGLLLCYSYVHNKWHALWETLLLLLFFLLFSLFGWWSQKSFVLCIER